MCWWWAAPAAARPGFGSSPTFYNVTVPMWSPIRRVALTVRQMQEAEGVTEALKVADQLEWVRRMNSIRNRAEEIIKTELIFV